jgi:type I restriction enzyme, S subunit
MKQGWEIKKLKDIADYFIGLTYSPKDVSDKGIVVLRSSNIQNGKLDFADTVRVNRPIKEGLKVKNGDILMCSRNGSKRLVGKTATIEGLDEEMTFGTFMTIIRSQYNSYLSWFFISNKFREQIGGGVNPMINQITKYMLDDIEIPLPPISEQQRIVSILDEVFALIAKAKAIAEQKLKNAKELFESYLQSVFENKDEEWEEKCLEEIIESNITGLTKNSSEQRLEYKYKYVKMNNITRDNRFDLSKYACVNATKEECSKYRLSEGDFLFNTRNSYELVGKTCLFEFNSNEIILYNNNIMRIRFIKNINPYFINYSFTTKSIIKKLDSLKSGTTNVSAIYYKDLKNLRLLIPPLKDQQTIVQKLDTLLTETKKLEAIYQKKLNDLEELKKSVLQKAFNDELKTA